MLKSTDNILYKLIENRLYFCAELFDTERCLCHEFGVHLSKESLGLLSKMKCILSIKQSIVSVSVVINCILPEMSSYQFSFY